MNRRIAQLITEAEHYISHQRYEEAEQCIAAAERIEPTNRSLRMVRELLATLRARNLQKPFFFRFFQRKPEKKLPKVGANGLLTDGKNQAKMYRFNETVIPSVPGDATGGAFALQQLAVNSEAVTVEKTSTPLSGTFRQSTEREVSSIVAKKKVQGSLPDHLRSRKSWT